VRHRATAWRPARRRRRSPRGQRVPSAQRSQPGQDPPGFEASPGTAQAAQEATCSPQLGARRGPARPRPGAEASSVLQPFIVVLRAGTRAGTARFPTASRRPFSRGGFARGPVTAGQDRAQRGPDDPGDLGEKRQPAVMPQEITPFPSRRAARRCTVRAARTCSPRSISASRRVSTPEFPADYFLTPLDILPLINQDLGQMAVDSLANSKSWLR